ALAGAALSGAAGWRWALVGAAAGAVVLGAADRIARARQRPGEIPALWSRILASGAIAAIGGRLLGRIPGLPPVAAAAVAGLIAGAAGLRPQKVALGPVVGLAVGTALWAIDRHAPASVAAALAVVGYRLISAILFRDPQVALVAERAAVADLPF